MNRLSELQSAHAALIARARATGRTILIYRAPCCGVTLEGIAALPGETWSTGSTCPECGALYFKVSTARAITAELADSARARTIH